MFDQDAVWALVGIGAACWALGGGGQKWIRRFVWSSVLGVVSYTLGVSWWVAILGTVNVAIVLSLGYGDSKVTWQRQLVFASIGGCLIPFGVSYQWAIAVYVLTSVIWTITQEIHSFQHKWWEMIVGAAQGAAVAWALLTR